MRIILKNITNRSKIMLNDEVYLTLCRISCSVKTNWNKLFLWFLLVSIGQRLRNTI